MIVAIATATFQNPFSTSSAIRNASSSPYAETRSRGQRGQVSRAYLGKADVAPTFAVEPVPQPGIIQLGRSSLASTWNVRLGLPLGLLLRTSLVPIGGVGVDVPGSKAADSAEN